MNKDSIFVSYCQNNPLKIIDVGALNGVKEPWNKYLNAIQVIGFEPQEETKKTAPTSLKMDSVALYDKQGVATMYITKRSDSSSLLKPNTDILDRYINSESFNIEREIEVETDTLDNQTRKHGIDFLDFIKLDTQGSELNILKNSQEILNNSVFGIEVEVNFINRYVGQNNFSEVDQFLIQNNFELFDLQFRFHKRKNTFFFGKPKGQITHGTALYFRTIKSTEKIIESASSKNISESLVLHYLLTVLIYGYNDFAWEIFNNFKHNIQDKHHSAIISQITKKSLRLPNFPFKYKLYNLFDFLAKTFKPYSNSGKTGTDTLGNF